MNTYVRQICSLLSRIVAENKALGCVPADIAADAKVLLQDIQALTVCPDCAVNTVEGICEGCEALGPFTTKQLVLTRFFLKGKTLTERYLCAVCWKALAEHPCELCGEKPNYLKNQQQAEEIPF